MDFTSYIIKKIISETSDTKTFLIDRPDSWEFKAGQYVTLKAKIGEEEMRRSYSMCTAPYESSFGFSVKRVTGGKVSNWLHDHISEGNAVELAPPEGNFVIEPQYDLQRDYYFIAAGSGITPVMSMIKQLLQEEPMSSIYLLYGSRTEESIIFKEEIDALMASHQDQLHVQYTLSKPDEEKAGGLAGLLGKKVSSWKGGVGRITRKKISEFLEKYPSKSGRTGYYLCGPGDMIETVEKALLGQGVKKEVVYREYFTSTGAISGDGKHGKIKVVHNGEEHSVEVKSDETILEAVLRHKIDAPYSCTSGACSSCLAKISEGKVEMDVCYALEEDEIEAGYILTCQSRLKTDKAIINYDV